MEMEKTEIDGFVVEKDEINVIADAKPKIARKKPVLKRAVAINLDESDTEVDPETLG